MTLVALSIWFDWGTTAEGELTLAEGVPTHIEVKPSSRLGDDRHYLWFTVAGHRTEYASYQPNFTALRRAVESGQPMHIWVSTKQETLFPRNGWVPLYKASVRGEPIVTYEEVVSQKKEGPMGGAITGFVLGCLVFGVGVVVLVVSVREYCRGGVAAVLSLEQVAATGAALQQSPPEKKVDPEADYWWRVKWMTVPMSVLLYSCFILVNLEPKVQVKLAQAFGPAPLGFPVLLVVMVAETLLYLPVPWFFWHGTRIVLQALSDRKNPSFIYLLTAGFHHPHLRKSQFISIGGVLYAILIAVSWVLYLTIQGV